MKILFSGDVAWETGRRALTYALPILKSEYGGFDFIIINCENAAHGKGLTPKIYEELKNLGVDAMTSGNHIWDKSAIFDLLNDRGANIFRPANYNARCPGRGFGIIEKDGKRLGILNLEGQVFMPPIDSPFMCADKILKEIRADEKNKNLPIIVDFHAEATSEKLAMGYYLDGRVSAVLGTHTHIQTADERVFPKGTAFICDVGMTGGQSGILGVSTESAIPKFLTGMPSKFEPCEISPAFRGVLIWIDDNTGFAKDIIRVQRDIC